MSCLMSDQLVKTMFQFIANKKKYFPEVGRKRTKRAGLKEGSVIRKWQAVQPINSRARFFKKPEPQYRGSFVFDSIGNSL